MGHLCVRSSGHIFATLRLSAHIGSHFSALFAGLQPEVNARSKKIPSSRGHKVSLEGFMSDMVITVFRVATKYMERDGKKVEK